MTRGLATVLAAAIMVAAVPSAAAAPAATTHDRAKPRPPGHAMVVSGVVLTVSSVVGYVVMGVGLNLGNRAEGELGSQVTLDDVDDRRDSMRLGRLGNRLAIGGAVSAAVLAAIGIPLIVVGRRRATAGRSALRLAPTRRGASLRWQLRF